MSRRQRICEYLILAPYFLVMLPIVLFLMTAVYIVHSFKSLVLHFRLRYAWPAQTWILLSYTQSAVWAPVLESEVIPRLGNACLVIDRSIPDWKQRHPIEARAIEHWGGYYEHNPLVTLLPKWRPAKVVRLYKAFLDKKHGRPKSLEVELAHLFAFVNAQGPKQ